MVAFKEVSRVLYEVASCLTDAHKNTTDKSHKPGRTVSSHLTAKLNDEVFGKAFC